MKKYYRYIGTIIYYFDLLCKYKIKIKEDLVSSTKKTFIKKSKLFV